MKPNDIDLLRWRDDLSVVPYFLGRDGARPSSAKLAQGEWDEGK